MPLNPKSIHPSYELPVCPMRVVTLSFCHYLTCFIIMGFLQLCYFMTLQSCRGICSPVFSLVVPVLSEWVFCTSQEIGWEDHFQNHLQCADAW